MTSLKAFVYAVCLACLLFANGHTQNVDRHSRWYLQQLFRVQNAAKPEYFTYMGQLKLWLLHIQSKMGGTLSKDEKDALGDYAMFKIELAAADLEQETEGMSNLQFQAHIEALIDSNFAVPNR